MKKNDPLEEELDDTLSKLFARKCDSDGYAQRWQQLAIELEKDPEFNSPAISKAFQRQITKKIKQHKRELFKKNIKRHRILTTAIVLVLLAVPVTALAVNKETVYNFVISIYDEYTTIQNKDEIYELTYLPSGYEFFETTTSGSILKTVYANLEGDKIVFWQYNGNVSVQLDTEETQLVQQIKIADMDALIVEKEGVCKLIWNTNPQFVLTGNLDKEEIIMTAEKIKRSD